MRDLERTWNSKFNYPWIFFNDKPFTEEFKKRTQALTKAKCQYGMQNQNYIHWTVGLTILRTSTEGTLGCPRLDQHGPLPRIRRGAEGAGHSV